MTSDGCEGGEAQGVQGMPEQKATAGRPRIAELTDPQRRTLEMLNKLIIRHKIPPTMKELAAACDVSVGTIQDQVAQLVVKGYVRKEPHKARNLTVLRTAVEEVTALVEVPIVGSVAAGSPIWAAENVIGSVTVDSSVARGRCFALRVIGDSMLKANIRSGDLVIVRQQQVAEHGDIVVALLDHEATVKRLSISDEAIQLLPENSKYRPIVIAPDQDFRIMGKVVAVRSETEKRPS